MKEKDVRFLAIQDIHIYLLYMEELWEHLMLWRKVPAWCRKTWCKQSTEHLLFIQPFKNFRMI